MAMFDSFKKANEVVRTSAEDAIVEDTNANVAAAAMRKEREDKDR